jgi:RNA polymerase sigma-70 factor (ECF subfamily)
MADIRWNLGDFIPLLRLRAQQLYWDPRVRKRYDWSDLVQDTLARAQERLPQFQGQTEGELIRWLLTIQANMFRDRLDFEKADMRSPNREQAIDAIVTESSARLEAYLADSQTTPSQHFEREQMLLRLAAALDQLPEPEREVVVLRYLTGATLAEVAECVGRPQTTVSRLLARGMDKLRQQLS